MPFEAVTERKFTAGMIQFYAPATPGIYGIANSKGWILIGTSDNIRGALLAHFVDRFSLLSKHAPTTFVFERCEEPIRTRRQKRLLLEYSPACNYGSL